MRREMTYEEKYKMMVETPVNKLIPRLAVPTIISMLITSIYNMADPVHRLQLPYPFYRILPELMLY